MAIRPTLLKSAPYDAQKDFIPIALYVKSPFILVVDPKLPIRSVPELIAYVKERPGKISYSSSGVGGAPHLSAEYMKQRFGSISPTCPIATARNRSPMLRRDTSRLPSQRPARRCR